MGIYIFENAAVPFGAVLFQGKVLRCRAVTKNRNVKWPGYYVARPWVGAAGAGGGSSLLLVRTNPE